jgi:serine/threonine-protein kinase RsbW
LRLRTLAQPRGIPELRHQVVAFARKVGASEAVGDAVRLAVSEALTNVVVHAYDGGEPGEMTVEAWRDDDRQQLVVVVLDEGRGVLPTPLRRGMGLGLGLMAQMADTFAMSSRDGTPGTVVSLSFALA